MPDTTPRSHGDTPDHATAPVYQGLLTWHCQECQKDHRLLIQSDDSYVANAALEGIMSSLKDAGDDPIGVLHTSHEQATDISPRRWTVPIPGF